MSQYLIKYEKAKHALAQAVSVDEVQQIRYEAEAMRAYAKMAKDHTLLIHASELKDRAERRLGEMMERQKEAGFLKEGRPGKNGGSNPPFSKAPTLEEVGIDKDLAKRCRKLAAIPEKDFEDFLGKREEDLLKTTTASPSKTINANTKRELRASKIVEVAQKTRALPNKRYNVILADPEWKFETYSESGRDRTADNHYSTSATDDIAGRDVESIAAADCVLFLWATVPMLPDALYVMKQWGFKYKSHFVWVKDKIGTGFWNRNKHEIFLIGTRGQIPAPAMGTQWNSVVEAPLGRHSEKPEMFLELIEHYFSDLPKIELNRRGPAREGWDAWGAEADVEDAA